MTKWTITSAYAGYQWTLDDVERDVWHYIEIKTTFDGDECLSTDDPPSITIAE